MADMNLPATPMKTVAQYLTQASTQKYLEAMLKERTGSFVASLVSLSNTTYGLQKCEPTSLMFCGLKAAALNLPLDGNLGFAYPVPYEHQGTTLAQFQIGYKGFVQLGQRSNQYSRLNALEIRKGELVDWDPFTERLVLALIKDPELRYAQDVIGYAARFQLLNGFEKIVYWPKAQVHKHGKRYSQTFKKNKGVWVTNFDRMGLKTVLKDLLTHWGPMSAEIQQAVQADQAVMIAAGVDDDGAPVGEPVITYPDNPERNEQVGEDGGDDGEQKQGNPEDERLRAEFEAAQKAKAGAQQTTLLDGQEG